MNILLINHYAGSPDMGMEFRPYYFAKEWLRMGHNVDIIAADFSHLRRKNPVVTKDFQKENIDGINYHWIKTNEYSGNGVNRAKTMAKFVYKLWKKSKWIIKKFDPDVVICSSTYPLDTFVAQRIRKLSKKKVHYIHELHDIWPETLLKIGNFSEKHPFIVGMQIGENSAYKNCDHLISLTQYCEDHCKEHYLGDNKFTCIPPAIDTDKWEMIGLPETHQKVFDELKDKFIVGYFGGHARSNALDVMMDVVQRIEKENDKIHFVLVGSGVEKNNIIELSKKMNLKNITFLDPVSKNMIPSLLENFDSIYMGTYKSDLYKYGMALNKMIDTMMSGKPAICSITAPPTWVELAESGIVVDSEDIDKTVEAILKVYNMSQEERDMMGSRGIDFAKENLDVKKLAKKFLDVSIK